VARAKPPARPFLPATRYVPPPPLTSTASKVWLVLSVVAAYVLQFGLGVLTAVLVFFIRQNGELDLEPQTTAQYLANLLIIGGLTFSLSMAVVLVYRARAHWPWSDLGVRPLPRTRAARFQWWRAAMVFLAALMTGFLVLSLLSFVNGSGDYPMPDTPAIAQLIGVLPMALMAGIGEELLVVAFLVVAMERLGAKPWLIYVVAVLARLAYHVYYGPGVIGLAIWAVAAVWVFRRTRLIVPSIAVHVLWDVNAGLGTVAPGITAIGALAALLCVVVTGIVHLVTRRQPDPFGEAYVLDASASGGGGTAPGWYPWVGPRPGETFERYWDGRAWTTYVR